MKRRFNQTLFGVVASVALVIPVTMSLAASDQTATVTTLSDADKAFVMKVSQGGMFEVEASKLAKDKAVQQDVIDTGFTEVHDHELVGAKLKSISTAAGLTFPTELNADFKSRLDRLKALSGAEFEEAYLKEMDVIHKADGAAFAQEAKAGTNTAQRQFAAETVRIVKRHIGSLHALPNQQN